METSWTNGVETYRYATTGDLADFATMLGDPEVARHLWFTPITSETIDGFFRPLLEAQEGALGKGELPETAVFTVLNRQGEFAGHGAAVAIDGSPGGFEIGFQLMRAAWGHGVGRRLSRFLRAYVVHLRAAYRIEGSCFEENAGSRRLLEELGLNLEGRKVGFRLREGVRHTELLYGAEVSTLDQQAIQSNAEELGLI